MSRDFVAKGVVGSRLLFASQGGESRDEGVLVRLCGVHGKEHQQEVLP